MDAFLNPPVWLVCLRLQPLVKGFPRDANSSTDTHRLEMAFPHQVIGGRTANIKNPGDVLNAVSLYLGGQSLMCNRERIHVYLPSQLHV